MIKMILFALLILAIVAFAIYYLKLDKIIVLGILACTLVTAYVIFAIITLF